jgi:small-conductance mechanosensitive channel
LKDVPPVIGVSSLAQSVVQISIQPWVSVADYGAVTAELSRTILEALRANRINLALAQHEVRLLQPQA